MDLTHKKTLEYHNGIVYRSNTEGIGILALGAIGIEIGNGQVYAVRTDDFDTLKTNEPGVPIKVRRSLVARAQMLVDRIDELETAPHPNEVYRAWQDVRSERFRGQTPDATQRIAKIEHYLGAYEQHLGVQARGTRRRTAQ